MLQSKVSLDDKACPISSKHTLRNTSCMVGAITSTSRHTAIAKGKLCITLGHCTDECRHTSHRYTAPPHRLASNDAALEFIVDLLVEEDEAEHGAAHTPLVGAVLEQDHLKECRQGLRQQLRPLPQVLTNGLHQHLCDGTSFRHGARHSLRMS